MDFVCIAEQISIEGISLTHRMNKNQEKEKQWLWNVRAKFCRFYFFSPWFNFLWTISVQRFRHFVHSCAAHIWSPYVSLPSIIRFVHICKWYFLREFPINFEWFRETWKEKETIDFVLNSCVARILPETVNEFRNMFTSHIRAMK